MIRYASPLRYPGGKARMRAWLASLLDAQAAPMDIEVWVEPFAGGAGAGLSLLADDAIGEVWLVERHPALAAFWQTVAVDGDRLADRVERAIPDLALWRWARERVATGSGAGPSDLAFAAFVVNRCSRSGIVAPGTGPIGGKSQSGRWTLAARWNGPGLAARIRAVAQLARAGRLRVFEGDGVGHLAELGDAGFADEVFAFVDPPYIAEGNRLYSHGMALADHARLAGVLNATPVRWVLTYDAHPAVLDMYRRRRVLAYEIAHTANRQRVGEELAVFSDRVVVSSTAVLPTGASRWVTDAPELTSTTRP